MKNLALFTMLTLLFATPASASLIVNGSFEQPLVPVGGHAVYLGGSTTITGWTVLGESVALISGAYTEGGVAFNAQEGAQFLDLTSAGSNSASNGVVQYVPTTAGQAYELSFYVGSANNGITWFPATVDLSIDGGPRSSFHNPNPSVPSNYQDWQQFVIEFVASNSTTTIAFYNGNLATNGHAGLDNVVLNTVPEPASWLLMAVGTAAIGIAPLRRRRLTCHICRDVNPSPSSK